MEKNYKHLIQEMNAALSEKDEGKINEVTEKMIENIDGLASAIKEHYNTIVYNVDNGNSGVKKYDEKSIVRELFQNIIDCNYSDEDDLKIEVTFDDDKNEIKFNYNESGFKINNIIAFFSLDHTTKNGQQTGAFGIGAKGALLNARSLSINSITEDCENKISTKFKISTIEQSMKPTLCIDELSIVLNEDGEQSGTNMIIALNEDIYGKIKSNLLDITGEVKGEYLTPIDLVFASLKKSGKKITITLDNKDNKKSIFINKEAESIKFLYNPEYKEDGDEEKGKGVGFQFYKSEDSKFVYLIYQSRCDLDEMPPYISKHKYNLFSTYELVGENSGTSGLKFFVNIPTLDKEGQPYITYDRTGIEPKQRNIVENSIRKDCEEMINIYSKNLCFYSNDTCSYMLEQFFDVIFYKFSTDIELKKKLCKNTYWGLNNGNKIKLSEIMFLKKRNEIDKIIKDVTEKYFCFYTEDYGKKSEYSKFMRFHYKFELWQNNNNCDVIEQYSEWEVDEPKKKLMINILHGYAQYYKKTEAAVYLLELEGIKNLSEDTLDKLLKVCKQYSTFGFSFSENDNIVHIDEKEYSFSTEFKIQKKKTIDSALSFCNNKPELEKFRNFIVDIYKNTVLKGTDDILEKIKKYKEAGLEMSFDDENRLVISVQSFVIDKFNLSDVKYDDVVSATGLSNYRLLKDKVLDESFKLEDSVENLYGYDIDKINYYAGKELSLSQIFICDSDYNLGDADLVVVVDKDNKINGIFNMKNDKNISYSDDNYYLLLPKMKKNGDKRSKLSIAEVSGFLDRLFDTHCIFNLYRRIDKPSVKFLDQLDYKYKPIFPINESEISEINKYLKFHGINKVNKVFSRDINNKLYGYSTCCPLCAYHSNSLDAFLVKEGIEYYEDDKKFSITLFMCANDFHESNSWLIEAIRFKNEYGQYVNTFKKWINNIKTQKIINPWDLKCKITIRKMSTDKLFDFDEEMSEQKVDKEIILIPALATKWYQDNERCL